MKNDPKFTLYWRTGNREVVQGRDIAEAMTLVGYGGGAVRALDFHCQGENTEYRWNPAVREWERLPMPHLPELPA